MTSWSLARIGLFAGLLAGLVNAHRSLPPGVTCGNQFNSSADALEIPDPKISWASYRLLTCDAPIFWLKAQVVAAGQNLSYSVLTPVISRFESVRISVVTIGAGLPALSTGDQAKVPAEVLADIQSGEGAVLTESPADQSTCSHLASGEMTASSNLYEGRCHFHEPYSDSRLWTLQDRTVVSQAAGMHRFAVFVEGKTTAKVSFACCDWPEDFTTPMTAPDAACPYCGTQDSFAKSVDHFYEHKDMAQYGGFPALQDCTADPGPPTPPNATQCPNETAADANSNSQPESCQLGCTGEECHSHNIFGQCTYDLAWIIPTPQLTIGNRTQNATSMILFKGDTVRFFVPSGHPWPHNLAQMQDQTHLDTCNWAGSTQIYTTVQINSGASHTFDTAGTFYFSCQMTGHCGAGQKLTVEVKDSSDGMKCHDHPHSGASSATATSMTCTGTDVKAYVIESSTYGATSGQCSEMCTSVSGMQWIAGAQAGSCADAGYTQMVESKSVQPGGSPAPMQVTIMQQGNATSPTCHCHSMEPIACDTSGDALYDEHIVEIQTYCQDVVGGSTNHCPYRCFQPFEILHLHYLECALRPKHSLFLQIDALDKCHEAAMPPYGVDCPKVDLSGPPPARDPTAYDSIWAGPGVDGAAKFATMEIIAYSIGAVVLVAIVAVVANWKHEAIENGIDSSFEVVGRKVGTYPCITLLISLFVGVVLCGGIGLSKSETNPAKLWVPSGSPSLDHGDIVSSGWPSNTRVTLLQAVPKNGPVGPNILTAANLKSMLRRHNELMAITIDGDAIVEASKGIADYSEVLGGSWTFQGTGNSRSKCSRWGSGCAMSSILAVFDYNEAFIGDDQNMLARIDRWDKAPINTVVPGLGYKGFDVDDVLGEVTRDSSGKVSGAKIFMWSLFAEEKEYDVMVEAAGAMEKATADAVLIEWEADAICMLGVQENHPISPGVTCALSDGDLSYVGLFSRSFSDEFGAAIRGDIAGMGIAYMLIIIYLFVNLGKRDTVHSMMMVSVATLGSIMFSYAGSWGLGSYLGLKQNPLNSNIVFLLLGLGVDDAFVLVSELSRHISANKDASVSELIALTARTGGSSVLITSFTDALAFLVGSSTKLPALSAFCAFAGLGVMLCFLFQIFMVLPVLALNVRRTSDNRYDCCCCFKSKVEHSQDEPQGCCCCLCVKACNCTDGIVRRAMERVAEYTVKDRRGRMATLGVWSVIFIVGLVGSTQIKKDFKLEWFFPDGSYVNRFITNNEEFFSEGTTFSFFTNDLDIFSRQAHMNELTSYIRQNEVIKPNSVNNWWHDFRPVPSDGVAGQSEAEFYEEIWDWVQTSSYVNSIRWKDDNCNSKEVAEKVLCEPTQGIAGTKIGSTLQTLKTGSERFTAYNKMRGDVSDIFGDANSAFPFTTDFQYWEENGVIDSELLRNLIIATGVIFCVILLTIPRPRIAMVVGLGIVMTMVELIGFMHWWGVTINGTSTIYILICLGLAVDYSAHIAHVFNISAGGREEEKQAGSSARSRPRQSMQGLGVEDRAAGSLARIGPSVFHALFSTILAVVTLSMSKSYVFRIFFQVLFLCTLIAGFKGLWLLPVALSIFGGEKNDIVDVVETKQPDKNQAEAAP